MYQSVLNNLNLNTSFQGKRQAELPLLIFGILSLIGAVAAVLLPETANQPLPQASDGTNIYPYP